MITDAVPKKRGPKTDVLEALLKRVDGLEARLKEKKTEPGALTPEGSPIDETEDLSSAAPTSHPDVSADTSESKLSLPSIDTTHIQEAGDSSIYSPTQPR
jgi:hypothetical protein